jgi:hypothetical protein
MIIANVTQQYLLDIMNNHLLPGPDPNQISNALITTPRSSFGCLIMTLLLGFIFF